MAGISGQSVAQTIAKNLSNLIESEKGAISASKSAYIDSQNSDKTAVIGPIRIVLNDPENDTGSVLNDGDSISPGDKAASRQKEREKNDAEIAVLDTQIFAKQAEIDSSLFAPEADGSQFSGAKQSETQSKLTDTYQSGDTGLARQLESRTYGVDSDKNLTTPGYETSFIDETGDKYGQSEQNIANKAIAFEKAQAEAKDNAVELMAEMKNDTLKAEILASQKVEDGIKQKALHDRLQNDRIDTIANLSDSAANKAAEKAAKEAELTAEKEASAALVAESLALTQNNLKQQGIKESAFQREKDVEKRIDKINDDLRKERIRKNTQDRFAQSQDSEGTSKALSF